MTCSGFGVAGSEALNGIGWVVTEEAKYVVQFDERLVMREATVALSATRWKLDVPELEGKAAVAIGPPGRLELSGFPYSSLPLRYAAAPAPAATGHTIGQKKKGKPRPAVPRPTMPGYPLPYVLEPKISDLVPPPAIRPAKDCTASMAWASPPPPLPWKIGPEPSLELELELFPELELELEPVPELEELLPELGLELEPFPELEAELELLPELELELEPIPAEIKPLFPPPFRRERLRRESREVMNGMNMAKRKNEKERRKRGVKRLRERVCLVRIRGKEGGYGANLIRCSDAF